MNNETNVINWQDAFKDEGFLSELKKFIDQCFEDNTASDEDIDEIFAYDENTETITINKNAFTPVRSRASEDDKDEETVEITEEDKDKATQGLRMKIMLSLMIDNGLILDKNNLYGDKSKTTKHEHHGNGQRAAEVMSLVTGIKLQTCRNFVSNQTLKERGIKNLIIKIENLLIEMGLKIRLT